MRAHRFRLIAAVAGCVGAPLLVPAAGQAAALQCGDVVTQSTVLQQDLTGCSSLAALTVTGPGVTLDLGGHEVSGTATYGLYVDPDAHDATVTNGRVSGFGYGVQVEGKRTRVTRLRAAGNGIGIHVGDFADHAVGEDAVVTHNVATGNSDTGIGVDQAQRPQITANVTTGNGLGIATFFAPNGTVERNQILANDRGGRASGADSTDWLSNTIVGNHGDGLFV